MSFYNTPGYFARYNPDLYENAPQPNAILDETAALKLLKDDANFKSLHMFRP